MVYKRKFKILKEFIGITKGKRLNTHENEIKYVLHPSEKSLAIHMLNLIYVHLFLYS